MKIHLCILPLKQKVNGTFSVKVRIYNREISSYITTDICVLETQWHNGVVVNHPDAERLNNELQNILTECRMKAIPFRDLDWNGKRIKDAILSDRYDEIVSELIQPETAKILRNPIIESSDITSFSLEIEHLSSQLDKIITKVNEASALLERFICNNKLRKREVKSLQLIIDYLNS